MRRLLHTVGCSVVLFCIAPSAALAGAGIRIDLGSTPQSQTDSALKMIVVMTLISLAPAILLTTTSFLRIVVVFAFLRSALGVQGMPPNQVMMGLALFLSIAIMTPVGTRVYQGGIQPYLDGELSAELAWETGSEPIRTFMLKQTRESDLALFYEIHDAPRPNGPRDVALHLLVPAYIISELRTAFEMGFMLFVPFLLLDLVVASILMSMGMVMLPPAMISLPIKVMLFVVADGWHLVVGSLVRSFA